MSREWIDAAISGDTEAIEQLIAKGGRPGADSLGQSALTLAAMRGHEECVRLLLPVSDVEQKSEINGRSAFELAMDKAQWGCARILATSEGVNAQDPKTQKTRLMSAVENGDIGAIEFLLDWARVEARDSGGRTAMHWAARCFAPGIAALLKGGANIDAADRLGRKPLALAVLAGNKASIQTLLQTHGVNPAERDSRGRAPFGVAVGMGRGDLARALADCASLAELLAASELLGPRDREWLAREIALKEKAIPSEAERATAASRALVEAEKSSMRLLPQEESLAKKLWLTAHREDTLGKKIPALLKKGAPPTAERAAGGSDGTSLLCVLARRGRAEALMAAAPVCDPLAADEHGRTALIMAALSNDPGSEDCARVLLPLSDPLAKDNQGRSALMIALGKGNAGVARVLIPFSDLSVLAEGGKTLLMLAAGAPFGAENKAQPELIKALLPHSRLDAKDDRGLTAFGWAFKSRSRDAMELLAEGASLPLAKMALKKHGETAMPRLRAWAEAKELREAANAPGQGEERALGGGKANSDLGARAGEEANNAVSPQGPRRKPLSL